MSRWRDTDINKAGSHERGIGMGKRFGEFRHLAGAVGAIALLSMTGLMLAAPAMADSNPPDTQEVDDIRQQIMNSDGLSETEKKAAIAEFESSTEEMYRRLEQGFETRGPAHSIEGAKAGEFFVEFGGKSSSVGDFGHAAVVYEDKGFNTVEAFPDTGVKHHFGDWYRKDSDVYLYGVTQSSGTKRANVAQYAHNMVGKKYSLTAKKEDERTFYCSKLVWLAWKKQGVDLDDNGGFFVTPADLANSKNSVLRWKSK